MRTSSYSFAAILAMAVGISVSSGSALTSRSQSVTDAEASQLVGGRCDPTQAWQCGFYASDPNNLCTLAMGFQSCAGATTGPLTGNVPCGTGCSYLYLNTNGCSN